MDTTAAADRARIVADGLDADERDLMLGWIDAVVEIRDRRASSAASALAVLGATADGDLLLVLGKVAFVEARRALWDSQRVEVRAALIVAAVVALAVAGAAIGVALVLGAVLAPVWLALGPGWALLSALHDELVRRLPPELDDAAGEPPI